MRRVQKVVLGMVAVVGIVGSANAARAASVPAPVFANESVIASAALKNKETPTALVKEFYGSLMETMKQGDKLGFQGRYKKLEPVVNCAFNLPLMTRFAVGPSWSLANAEERARMTSAFSSFSVATYASRFPRYHGEQFEVVGERPAAQGGVIVETKLVPKGEEAVILNYLVRKDDKAEWRIVDVYLDASISELATRRSEYGAIIQREGLPALIAMLVDKNKKLGV